MCGIFGYIGSKKNSNQSSVSLCLEGLKKLEYRGYDSAGVAGVSNGKIESCKSTGRILTLEKKVKQTAFALHAAIGHTRWATHGKPTKINAHPQFDQNSTIALVHNGIIENFDVIKERLIEKGVHFKSDTDTEVIAQLISYYYNDDDLLKATQKALKELKGAFAIAFVHKNYPDQIIAASRESPLAIGYNKELNQVFLSSDPNALRAQDLNILFLHDNEIALLKADDISISDLKGQKQKKDAIKLEIEDERQTKEHFEHFMLKEIYEQPKSIKRALKNRLKEEFGTVEFEDLSFSAEKLQSIHRILILGCGTSYHAALIGRQFLESIARIPTEVEIASEFRYSNPIVSEDTLVIAISQSGETADTLAAIREVKAKGAKVLGVCNVNFSTLSREADSVLFLRAGPEISVCSTKAFTSQLTLLYLFTLYMGRLRHLSKEEGSHLIDGIKKIPHFIEKVLESAPKIEALAEKYYKYEHFFFLGRRYMFPSCLEAALKLKEISYVNASGYPAGEMKHGPIALISKSFATVALCGNKQTLQKMYSSISEIKSREGPVLIFSGEKSKELQNLADDVFLLPDVSDELASILYSVAGQLFAYYVAKKRGTDIDKPRNLAKSVTVE